MTFSNLELPTEENIFLSDSNKDLLFSYTSHFNIAELKAFEM